MISDIYSQGQSTRGLSTTPPPPIPSIEITRKSERPVSYDVEARIRDLINEVREEQSKPLPVMLAGRIRQTFNAAKTAKTSAGIDRLLDSCLNARKGEYEAEDLAKIRQATPGGSEIYMMLSNNKSRACEAILKNTLLPAGIDKPWGIDPSPVPNLPNAVSMEIDTQLYNEAKTLISQNGVDAVDENQIQDRQDELRKRTMTEIYRRAKNQTAIIEKYLEDQLIEGGFYEELAKIINDISIFPTAFLKGPVVRQMPVLRFDDETQRHVVEQKPVRQYDRLSPYQVFPAPSAKHINDGPLCIHHRLRLTDLQKKIGIEGFNDDAIRAVLVEYGQGGLKDWINDETDRAIAEGRPLSDTDPDPQIDAVEFWGAVQGRELIEWGMSTEDVPKPEYAYNIEAWLIGDWIIMARMNPHPMGRNPVFTASFSYNNDSIWGESPIMLMKSEQKACNATARALFNRMGFSSGPIIEILWDRLAPGENPTDIRPWMLIKTRSDINSPSQAVYLTEFNPYSNIYLQVYQYFAKQASETTGIPDYMSGSASGANPTSSGFAMQINNMNAMMRNVVMGVDDNIIKKALYEHWLSIMLYDDDVPKIGDVNIRVRASDYIMAQEQLQLRRNEALQTTDNDTDLSIIGKTGRAKMLRENFQSLKYDSDIVPTDEEIQANEDKDAIIQQLIARIAQLESGGTAGPGVNRPVAKKGAEMTADGGAQGKEPGRLMGNG